VRGRDVKKPRSENRNSYDEEARTWDQRPGSSGYRARLHGHEPELQPPPADRQEMISLLPSAVERGITFFDTAEVNRRTQLA